MMSKEKLIKLMYEHSSTMKVGSDGDYEQTTAIDFESFGDLADDIIKLKQSNTNNMSLEAQEAIKRIKTGASLTDSDVNILETTIKELQHFKDSSVGLYCTDLTPERRKDLSKEQVEKQLFQLH
jgi:predicted transcriptional regulator